MDCITTSVAWEWNWMSISFCVFVACYLIVCMMASDLFINTERAYEIRRRARKGWYK